MTSKPLASRWIVFFAILMATFVVWLVWGFAFVPWRFANAAEPYEAAGQFGDLFGGVNALFTAFAFAAVWWTGWLQREELQLQREELSLQRGELASTRVVFERQNFESTFFQQLQLFRQIGSQIHYGEAVGESALSGMSRYVKKIMLRTKDAADTARFVELTAEEYDTFYTNFESELGPYFRTMYHIFKLIDNQQYMSDAQKIEYANLARAQMSSDTLVLLAGNLTSQISRGFRHYVEKYGILKHLPREEWFLAFSQSIDAGAFQGSEDRANR